MLPEEILFNKNINFDELFEENMNYFYHLMKLCACYKCICGSCYCEGKNLKLKYVPGMNTTY